MISTHVLKRSLLDLGYRSADVLQDYRFAALDEPGYAVKQVDVAAFLDSPASYRNAAIAIVRSDGVVHAEAVARHRSLGAPYLIALARERASAWTYTATGPTKLRETPLDNWQTLFSQEPELLRPQAIRDVKASRLRVETGGQLSLFDPRTLFLVQAQTQRAVHEMLESFIDHFAADDARALVVKRDFAVLFPLVFRMLAAKILLDRGDMHAAHVDLERALSVQTYIEQLYSLPGLDIRWNAHKRKQLDTAWDSLRRGLFVRNVAAEDLAFVYENTLISPSIRRSMGTHSTPACVAEYVIRSFDLPQGDEAAQLSVYEPFAGSCVFLTSALARFKELLPTAWSTRKTHQHLVQRFQASELDPFAAELARLSLILADYPNHNGWRIEHEDVFAQGMLTKRASVAQVTVCNPPFEDFPKAAQQNDISVHKPIAALEAILDAKPAYLGIVMPDGFGTHKKYARLLDRVLRTYADVEILELPEGAFRKASVGAAVLIAQRLREQLVEASGATHLRRSAIGRAGWDKFQQTLQPSTSRTIAIDVAKAPWISGLRPLADVWEQLRENPRLGDIAELHRGLEWSGDQTLASRNHPAPGYRNGLHQIAGSLQQFEILQTTYLDCRPSKLRRRAIDYPWHKPKIICNAVRMSREPWRLAAAIDLTGLIVSQQYFGVWLRATAADGSHAVAAPSLVELACVLNSPVANAYSYCHDAARRLRVDTMEALPLPPIPLANTVGGLVREYLDLSKDDGIGPLFSRSGRTARDVLLEIDAAVLAAYDLPPRLERELLRLFGATPRPLQCEWEGYPGLGDREGALPLQRRLALKEAAQHIRWLAAITVLPDDVADAFDQV
jgi:hypothetical protein